MKKLILKTSVAALGYLIINSGCANYYQIGIGEKGKSDIGYKLAAVTVEALRRDMNSNGRVSEDVDRSLQVTSKVMLDTDAEISSKVYSVDDAYLLRKNSSLDDVLKVMGRPDNIIQNEGAVIYEYYSGHLLLFFKNNKLSNIRGEPVINGNRLPIDLSTIKKFAWIKSKVIANSRK